VFRDAAVRLAGLAGALLGWRPDEFWRATPAELAAVLEAIAGGGGAGEGFSQDELGRLKRMFPDG
jgi:uncharacterized phage protein (TIGR02216 family)